MFQDTLPKVAKLSGTSLPCWQVQGEFCQELILQIMPSYHFYSWTCLKHYSNPAYMKYVMQKMITESISHVEKTNQHNMLIDDRNKAPRDLSFLLL